MTDTSHTCPAPGCKKQVRRSQFACRGHWFSIPKEIRSRIWSGYLKNEDVHRQAMADGLAFLRAATSIPPPDQETRAIQADELVSVESGHWDEDARG